MGESCVLREVNPHLQGFSLKLVTELQTSRSTVEAGFWYCKGRSHEVDVIQDDYCVLIISVNSPSPDVQQLRT